MLCFLVSHFIRHISSLQARNLETSLNAKLAASGRTVTPGDLYAVTVRRGKYQDGVPYQPGQEIQPAGDGSVTHILEAFGVSAGGETINFKRVTGAELRKMEGGVVVGENVTEVAGDGEGGIYDFKNLWELREYIREVERITSRKLIPEQLAELRKAIKMNKFGELPKELKKKHRIEFIKERGRLVAEWEKHSGTTWPKYDQAIFSDNGRLYKVPGWNFDAHELIPNDHGGPIEWWNIHPAKWKVEHQKGIHGSEAKINDIISKWRK